MSTAIPGGWNYSNVGTRTRWLQDPKDPRLKSTDFQTGIPSSGTYIARETVNSPPGWKKAKIKPFNPFYYLRADDILSHGFKNEFDIETGTLVDKGVGHWANTSFEVEMPSISALTAEEIDSMDAQARTKIRLKLKDQHTNFANVFAERERSRQLVIDTAHKLVDTVVNLKRGNISGAARALGVSVSGNQKQIFKKEFKKHQSKAVANGWLELQYGWIPLIDDARGAAYALHKLSDDTIAGRVSSVQKRNARLVNTGKTTASVYPRDFTHQVIEEYTLKYIVYYSISLKTLSDGASFGLLNPFSVAWEVLPWSFAIDWFLPIGDWINSWDATLGLSFAGGSVTRFRKTNRTASEEHKRSKTGSTYTDSLIISSRKRVECRRSILTSFPDVAFPDFKNPLSFNHCANALALLRQSFR